MLVHPSLAASVTRRFGIDSPPPVVDDTWSEVAKITVWDTNTH